MSLSHCKDAYGTILKYSYLNDIINLANTSREFNNMHKNINMNEKIFMNISFGLTHDDSMKYPMKGIFWTDKRDAKNIPLVDPMVSKYSDVSGYLGQLYDETEDDECKLIVEKELEKIKIMIDVFPKLFELKIYNNLKICLIFNSYNNEGFDNNNEGTLNFLESYDQLYNKLLPIINNRIESIDLNTRPNTGILYYKCWSKLNENTFCNVLRLKCSVPDYVYDYINHGETQFDMLGWYEYFEYFDKFIKRLNSLNEYVMVNTPLFDRKINSSLKIKTLSVKDCYRSLYNKHTNYVFNKLYETFPNVETLKISDGQFNECLDSIVKFEKLKEIQVYEDMNGKWPYSIHEENSERLEYLNNLKSRGCLIITSS